MLRCLLLAVLPSAHSGGHASRDDGSEPAAETAGGGAGRPRIVRLVMGGGAAVDLRALAAEVGAAAAAAGGGGCRWAALGVAPPSGVASGVEGLSHPWSGF